MINAILCGVMLGIGNVFYEVVFPDVADYARAFEHTYYQLVAIMVYYFVFSKE